MPAQAHRRRSPLVLLSLPLAAVWAVVGCSSGLGNNLPVNPTTGATSARANLPTGLDLGVTPTDPIAQPAIAGAVIPSIAGADAREVVFVGFVSASSSADADGNGTPLARDNTVDGNGALDVFVAAVCASDIDTSAFSQSLAGKFRHPRCVTCHMMQANDTLSFVSSPQPHAGPPPGSGFPNNDPATCAPCHVNSTNFPVVGWQAPAASFDFRTKSVADLAVAANNVPADETEHFFTDARVLWALDSGVLPQVGGRNGIADDDHDGILEPEDTDGIIRTVPGGSASFLADFEAWDAGGRVVTTASAVHDITLVSRSTDGVTAGNGASSAPRLLWVPNPAFNGASSATAQATNPVGTLFVAFQSDASDLVGADANGATDVFRAAVTVRAEEDATGAVSPGSLNLVFQNATVLASAIQAGTAAGNGTSTSPVLAGPAAEFVAFQSTATDLVPGFADNNGAAGTDVFVRTIGTNQTALLSHTPGAATNGGDAASSAPALAKAGDVIAFASDATDLVAGDANAGRDVFFTDRTGGAPFALSRASVQTGGAEATGGSDSPSVFSDGAGKVLVAFVSAATDLAGTVAATNNVYLHDNTGAGTTTLLNQRLLDGTSVPGDGDAGAPVLAEDGAAVLFESAATNIDVLRDDTNGYRDIYAVETGQIGSGKILPYRVNITGKDGGEANGDSTAPQFGSFAGASATFPVGFTVYSTAATNLGTTDSSSLMVSFLSETSGVQAAFSANPTSGAVPLAVQFTDASSGLPESWAWDFDNDGNVDSTERSPSFTYTTPGTFTVTLTATNATSSGSKTETALIRAFGPPVVDFTATPTTGNRPLSVAFTDTSTESPTAWAWDFDSDGNVDATVQNPTFAYATAGTYSVTLTATGIGGTGTATKTDFVTVTDPVVADFSATPTSGLAPLTVNFTDLTTGGPTSWSWDFDNDGNADSTLQNPSFDYTSPGNYTVVLTATGPGGTDSETKASFVAVAGAVVANFTSNVTSGYAPAMVNFTDTSTGTITSWAWDFNNDNVVDSTAQNPSFTYTTPGVYSVKLTASGPGGTDDELKTNYFTAVVSSVSVTFGASQDTTIYEESTANSNGAGVEMVAGNAANGGANVGTRRALVAFDVSSIPAGSTILSSALTLTNTLAPGTPIGSQNISLFRATRTWGESTSTAALAGSGAAAVAGDATWLQSVFGTTNWTSAGGDFLAGARATRTIGEVANTAYTWTTNPSLVADVQLWLDTPAQNAGWMLRGGETNATRTVKWFATKENATAGFRPSLAVSYRPPLP